MVKKQRKKKQNSKLDIEMSNSKEGQKRQK